MSASSPSGPLACEPSCAGALPVGISVCPLDAAHEPALARYVGSANVALLPYASAYSVIRILALPAGIISAVAQSAFLAVRDPWTPLKAVTLTTVLNLVLDLWFVTGLGWGIAGAAWATSASQVITMALLIRALVRRGPQIDKVKETLREAKERAKELHPDTAPEAMEQSTEFGAALEALFGILFGYAHLFAGSSLKYFYLLIRFIQGECEGTPA